MKRYIGAALVAAGLMGTVEEVGAQADVVTNVAAWDSARPNELHVVTGVEYGFVAGLGYTRGLSVLGRTTLLTASVTMPIAGADAGDYATRLGATVPLAGRDRWRLGLSLGGSMKGIRNPVSEMTSLGADGALVGGYYRPRWFLAAEGGYDGAIATHIDHTESYRDEYEGAQDGWYVDTGSNIRLGLAAGMTFGRYDIIARAGQARDRSGNNHMIPAYATIGAGVRF